MTSGLTVAIVTNLSPLLLGPAPYPEEWQWAVAPAPDLRPPWLIVPLSVATLIAVILYVTRDADRLRGRWLLVLAALTLAFWLGVQMTSREGLPFVRRTMFPGYISLFIPTRMIRDLPAFIDTYAERSAAGKLSYRQNTHPPGDTFFFWSVIRGTRAVYTVLPKAIRRHLELRAADLPNWRIRYTGVDLLAANASAFLIAGLAAFTVFPLYGLARALSGEGAARLAVALYAFTPAVPLFLPAIDALYTLIAASALWLIARGLNEDRRALAALGGAGAGLVAFMSYSALPFVLVVGLFVVLRHTDLTELRRRPGRAVTWMGLLIDAAAVASGALLVWVLPSVLLGYDPVATFRAARISGDLHRSYWLWLAYNPYDVLLMAGTPVAFFALRAMIQLARRVAGSEPLTPADRLVAAFVLGMTVLLVSGVLRGETSRVLLYTNPVLAWIAAANVTNGADSGEAGARGAIVCALMVAQTLIFYPMLRIYL